VTGLIVHSADTIQFDLFHSTLAEPRQHIAATGPPTAFQEHGCCH
jgi:hypothetical protein